MMTYVDAYRSISERSVDTAEALIEKEIFENAIFHSYHAFESIGGALCHSQGLHFPRKHISKTNQFQVAANRRRIGRGVGALAIAISSLRSESLYPYQNPDGSIESPERRFNKTTAKDLLKRVKGVKRKVENAL